tara:strand:+ start:178 stop:552 length:375 start_codon:yes stop_codon:yes gene_type:complete
MSNSAKKQVEQTAGQALEAVNNNKVERVAFTTTGKSVNGKVMFDSMKAIKLPHQLGLVIKAYYEAVDALNGSHQLVSMDTINELVDFSQYQQDAPTILKHYKLQIEGTKPWKYAQGCVKIGTFG